MSAPATETPRAPLRLGLKENIAQFALLVGVNALVSGMLTQAVAIAWMMFAYRTTSTDR
jgi:hypothetical protein